MGTSLDSRRSNQTILVIRELRPELRRCFSSDCVRRLRISPNRRSFGIPEREGLMLGIQIAANEIPEFPPRTASAAVDRDVSIQVVAYD